ncbi:hypothetical protein PHMEG_0002501 [Phytophthora megakarya]|uniref:Uncharacterized protein n=1 Tax=Phytophthora megakarya TaxID=4795 RepID=A0A225WY79_9STRA|nr:hypothetical protein PHMEG_0002501 [Phytophthora megakarya]
MEDAINEHKKTHASECELCLDAALKSSHDTFEAATDLQAEWIESRLNTKLKVVVEAETIAFDQARKILQGQAAELVKSHASTVEERLQQNLDSAMNAARIQTLSKLGERFGDMSSALESYNAVLR